MEGYKMEDSIIYGDIFENYDLDQDDYNIGEWGEDKLYCWSCSVVNVLQFYGITNVTQDEIGQVLGRARVSIANTLRLLKLPQEIQEEIKKGRISFAHGRSLLEVENTNQQHRLTQLTISKELSVRELENLIKRLHSLMLFLQFQRNHLIIIILYLSLNTNTRIPILYLKILICISIWLSTVHSHQC